MQGQIKFIFIAAGLIITSSSIAHVATDAAKVLVEGGKNLATKQGPLLSKLYKPASAELRLIEKYGDKVQKKVRNDTAICVANRIRQGQKSQAQKNMTKEERKENAAEQCADGFLRCMDTLYKSIKDPNIKFVDRCIAEVNTKFERYTAKK